MKRKNLILSIACTMLVLLVAGSVFCFSGCNNQDEIEYKWELNGIVYTGDSSSYDIGVKYYNYNVNTTEDYSLTLAAWDGYYVLIDIHALLVRYENDVRKDSVAKVLGSEFYYEGVDAKLEYSYQGEEETLSDNIKILTPFTQLQAVSKGGIYLELEEGVHELKFITPSVPKYNLEAKEITLTINAINMERQDGVQIEFFGEYTDKYSPELTGSYELYVVDKIPSFKFAVEGQEVILTAQEDFRISLSDNDKIHINVTAIKIDDSFLTSSQNYNTNESGLYLYQVVANGSKKYSSICKCFLIMYNK